MRLRPVEPIRYTDVDGNQRHPPGLLARLANFVRNPSAEAPVRNLATSPQEGEAGKQTIKRMIERKAHNDAVRQREFSQLRKLRGVSPAALSEMGARASFFQDSSGFPEVAERESTLRKIDDIEAQMSKQLWKGQLRQPADATSPAKLSEPAQTPPKAASARQPQSQRNTYNTFAPTMPFDLAQLGPAAPDRVAKAFASPRNFGVSGVSGFSNSKMVSIDMGQALSDPVLQDAAIRFANSDDTGAESVLLQALQGNQTNVDLKNTWTTALLDMYRCTGQLARYEHLVQSATGQLPYAHPDSSQRPSARMDDSPDISASGLLTELTPFVDASASRVAMSGEVIGSAAAALEVMYAALLVSGDVLVRCDSGAD